MLWGTSGIPILETGIVDRTKARQPTQISDCTGALEFQFRWFDTEACA